jgi:hypothetical protein
VRHGIQCGPLTAVTSRRRTAGPADTSAFHSRPYTIGTKARARQPDLASLLQLLVRAHVGHERGFLRFQIADATTDSLWAAVAPTSVVRRMSQIALGR